MSIELIVVLAFFSLLLFTITTVILIKGFIPAKYSLLWYFIAIVIFLVAIFSKPLEFFANAVGFQTLSNMIIGIILALLIFLTMSLTIIISTQKKKTTLLIQELSLLKSRISSNSDSNVSAKSKNNSKSKSAK